MKPEYVGHYVRAVYDFETNHPREINLQKGDIIKVTKNVDSNWLHGINRNNEGNFPSSFVEKIVLPAVSQGNIVFGAIENFPAQQDGDLEFRKGVVIEGTEKLDDNWWRGRIGTQTGIFPTTHVMELELPQSLRERAASVHSSEPMFARALCDSVAQLDEELGFHAGDMVTVTEIIDDDWYYGELGNKKGMFLSSCVELIQDTYLLSQEKVDTSRKTYSSSQEKVDNSRKTYSSSQETVDNSKNTNVLQRHSAVDQSESTPNQETNFFSKNTEVNFSDVNANIGNQTENYPESSTELNEVPEYSTQFSYTKENTRSLESFVAPYGMTLYSFLAESPNELSFNENEIVYLIQHVDSQWIEGQIDDKIGIFPANFVSIVVDCPYAYDTDNTTDEQEEIQSESRTYEMKSETNITSTDNQERNIELFPPEQYGLVLYNFIAEVESDLTVSTGDTLVIVKNIDSNWVLVRNDHDQVGMVPKQFLDIVSEFPDQPVSVKHKNLKDDSAKKTDRHDTNICDKNLTARQKSSDIDMHQDVDILNSKDGSSIYDMSHSKSVDHNIPIYTPCSKTSLHKKPALPSKPKQILAPKPILKPKPILSPKPINKPEVKTGPIKSIDSPKITKSLTFQDDTSLHKSSSSQSFSTKEFGSNQLSKSSSAADISNGSNVNKTDNSKESLKAFSAIDSMVESEMRKNIKKAEDEPNTVDSFHSGQNHKVEFNQKRTTLSFNKNSQFDQNKRHSVNFPLSSSTTDRLSKQSNRQSVALASSPRIEQPSLKVGYSTFFTDFSTEELKPTKVGPMRTPPPQKIDTIDFSRKPSLRKPPPPRPSVPKERPLSPTRPTEGPTIVSSSNKSKKGDKVKKDQSKRPRPHITPTRPAPQRPTPGQVARRPPPRPPDKQSNNLMSFSPTSEDQQDDTHVEIIDDLKRRIKEVEADLEKYKKSKQDLESTQSHEGNDAEIYDNIEFYTANIEGLTQELETLKESLNKVLPSSELDAVTKQMEEEERKKEELKRQEEDRKKAEEARLKRRDKRERVIDELIQTEKDYLNGLHLCIETFISPTGEKNAGVDIDAVFGNIEDVADVSQRLLTLLENAVNGQDFEDQLLGPCFTQLCDDMKNAYAPYCRNHDEVIAILEKYREDQSIKQYFNEMLNKLREKIVVFDLEALLIKPVQRILKYPLLLNELIKSTEDSHKDKVEILNGINAMTDVAKAINEYKRRKDLVYKYKRETDQSLGDMLAKLNFHSLKKKGSRFKWRLSTNLGIAPQTKDEDFEKEETKFTEIEKTIRIFAKDVQTYMDQLQESYSCHEGLVMDLVDIYDEKTCPEVQKYEKLYHVIQQQFLPEFASTTTDLVVVPLSNLIVMFNGPNKVIQKRFDKLLDFHSMQRKEEKGSEKSLQAAKSNYEALNAQLLDELPKMYSLSFKLLKDCIKTFVQAQKKFYTSILHCTTETINMSLLLQTEGTVTDNFNIHHVTIIDKMSVLRIIPKGFNPKMEVLAKPVTGKSVDKKSKRMSVPMETTLSPVSSAVQSDSQRVFVQQKYPPDKLYKVTTSYTAADLMDISVIEGVCVGLIVDKDPMGNKNRWFVDDGATQGFVPKTVLKLYSEVTTGSAQNIYPSVDETVLLSDVTNNVIGEKSPISAPLIAITDSSSDTMSTNQIEDDENELDFALDEDMSPNISSEEFYYALYAFTARNNNEITLFDGQVITVLIKHDQENNTEWWYVDADGVKGYAPANFLQPMG